MIFISGWSLSGDHAVPAGNRGGIPTAPSRGEVGEGGGKGSDRSGVVFWFYRLDRIEESAFRSDARNRSNISPR